MNSWFVIIICVITFTCCHLNKSGAFLIISTTSVAATERERESATGSVVVGIIGVSIIIIIHVGGISMLLLLSSIFRVVVIDATCAGVARRTSTKVVVLVDGT